MRYSIRLLQLSSTCIGSPPLVPQATGWAASMASREFMSSPAISNPNRSQFCLILCTLVLLGRMTKLCCNAQRSSNCSVKVEDVGILEGDGDSESHGDGVSVGDGVEGWGWGWG